MTDTTYNGWTNYETWRVNLEMIDGTDLDHWGGTQEFHILVEAIKESCTDIVAEQAPDGSLAQSYALAFLDAVNWREIAGNLVTDHTINAA